MPGMYNVLDNEFSNDFSAIQYNNNGGAIFSYKKPKTTLNFGTRITATSFDQYEALTNQSYNRSLFLPPKQLRQIIGLISAVYNKTTLPIQI